MPVHPDYADLLPLAPKYAPPCYPEEEGVFRVLSKGIADVKVLLLGQDPYHNGSATGRAFEVENVQSAPNPSLRNMQTVLGHAIDFDSWESQGVLLLNTALTVAPGKPDSHTKEWKPFIHAVIHRIAERNPSTVLLCLGAKAYAFAGLFVGRCVVSSHPSPLSWKKPFKEFPSFYEGRVFDRVNELLVATSRIDSSAPSGADSCAGLQPAIESLAPSGRPRAGALRPIRW